MQRDEDCSAAVGNVAGQDAGKGEQMRIGLEIEVSDKELLGRLANVKEKRKRLIGQWHSWKAVSHRGTRQRSILRKKHIDQLYLKMQRRKSHDKGRIAHSRENPRENR